MLQRNVSYSIYKFIKIYSSSQAPLCQLLRVTQKPNPYTLHPFTRFSPSHRCINLLVQIKFQSETHLTHPVSLARPLYWHAPSGVSVCAHASTPIIIHIRQSSHLEIVGGATIVCSRTCARAGIRG